MTTAAPTASPSLEPACRALALGDLAAAETASRRFLSASPDDPAGAYVLGLALSRQGRLRDAEPWLSIPCRLDPPQLDCLNEYARVLHDLGEHARAATILWKAVKLYPTAGRSWESLSRCLLSLGVFADAVRAAERAIGIDPNQMGAYRHGASAWASLGIVDEAARWLSRALQINPRDSQTAAAWANLLNYVDVDPAHVQQAHARFGALCDVNQDQVSFDPSLAFTDQPVRLAFLSPDLRDHPVGQFMEPFLRLYRRDQFSVTIYSSWPVDDAVSRRLAGLAATWRNVTTMTDRQLADAIRTDRIQVLVDLAGLTGNSRVSVLALRPAPLQLTYLGYPNTTGISAADARIVDAVTDPPESPPIGPERRLRLSGPMHCWNPPHGSPPPNDPPMLRNGHPTFGSFSNLQKLSVRCLSLWARILTQLPAARLLIKGHGLADQSSADLFRRHLSRCGVPLDRVELLPRRGDAATHLADYHKVDVSLDSMPYCGVTTTCDSLWMGVPVVTLTGSTHAARCGASVLASAGLPQWIATDPDAYVNVAVTLASDPDRLKLLRHSLRDQVASAALCNGEMFTRRFSETIENLWFTRRQELQCPRSTPVACAQ